MPTKKKPVSKSSTTQRVEKLSTTDSRSEHVDTLHKRIAVAEALAKDAEAERDVAEASLLTLSAKYGALRQYVIDHYGIGVLDVFAAQG